jgi:Flp pilus assembly pilin Flp
MNTWIKSFWQDEEGLGTLEILLIVAVLVAIAIAFREYIISWVNKLFDQSDGQMKQINDIEGIKKPGSGGNS